jgi:glycosyltransferase involved in cell wall biosynthesis
MISVIIPVWNQGHKARNTFLEIIDVLGAIKNKYEVIFIDDGSTDDSFEILKDIHSNYSNVKVIRLEQNVGQHQALFAGFESAGGEIIITADADGMVSPKYIPDLLSKFKEGYDIVVAWRAKRPGLGLLRRWGSFLINAYTNFITGQRIHDHACSLKVFDGQLIRNNIKRPELRRFFGIEIARYANLVAEIKVECLPKHNCESSLGLIELSRLALQFITSNIKRSRNKDFEISEVLN